MTVTYEDAVIVSLLRVISSGRNEKKSSHALGAQSAYLEPSHAIWWRACFIGISNRPWSLT